MQLREATIDLAAISHNYQQIKKLAPDSKIIAVIKSNAYGHGLIQVAKTLTHADAFGISVIEEAVALRAAGITQRIILMTGVCSVDEFGVCAQHNIEVVVHQQRHVEMLAQLASHQTITVWLKMDVGMHRLGFDPAEVNDVFAQLASLSVVAKPIYLMSHLPNADVRDDNVSANQIKLFKQFADDLNTPSSLAKSAGVIAWPESHFHWVRPGIMLYGISPLVGCHGSQHGLIPAMNFSAKIIAVRRLRAGDQVSYGGDWQCPQDMTVAVVGAGYGSGYPRHAAVGTPVIVNGKTCGLIGRVCMDMIVIDCRDCPGVKLGDTAILWGKELPVEVVANHAETIAYELVCHASERIKTLL